jgi:hypothetical protein
MSGSTPPLTQYAFVAWCLVKHRDNFTSTFETCTTGMSCMTESSDMLSVFLIKCLLYLAINWISSVCVLHH